MAATETATVGILNTSCREVSYICGLSLSLSACVCARMCVSAYIYIYIYIYICVRACVRACVCRSSRKNNNRIGCGNRVQNGNYRATVSLGRCPPEWASIRAIEQQTLFITFTVCGSQSSSDNGSIKFTSLLQLLWW